ncbi:hypothetical protein RclHR1_09700004 [Rhizophagus clarus]|uniref:Lysozyme n=1 Tax=Rhizophagus clarus TaxID=94130 RepID=A0A2Z6SF93_9GLOM|nr:hypothetical protein RclHR1_09700004 [Rhizophagus clarus]
MTKILPNVVTLVIVLIILVTITSSELLRRVQTINRKGLKLIKKFEGFHSRFYRDSLGIRTIGYGHSCDIYDCSNIRPPVSHSEAKELLKKDLIPIEKCVASLTHVKLNSNQFSALVSFTFSVGCGAYRESTLRRKLNDGDTKGASKEFKKWAYIDGKKLRGLKKRRKAEKKLFCRSGGC